jgi:hypothetical protein
MPAVTAVLLSEGGWSPSLLGGLAACPRVHEFILVNGEATVPDRRVHVVKGSAFSGRVVARVYHLLASDYLLVVLPDGEIDIDSRAIERMIQAAQDTCAGLLYSDFKDVIDGRLVDHPLIDYQIGSIRDSFDFGQIILISKRALDDAFAQGPVDETLQWGGWYDLRLRLSINSSVVRVPEPLYTRVPSDRRTSGERQFDYLNPGRREYQLEMEKVATQHLKRIGAFLAPDFRSRPPSNQSFPLKASVVIPVRNRERTIKDAVTSALSQQTGFPFNVIVIDNHSTDGTTAILRQIASADHRLIHVVPSRRDLGIGGCWNEAIYSEHCGEYAVQLDSDDLYADQNSLARVIAKFDEGNYAMVIGSYTIVNFDLEEIAPGLIDHREWTRENGRNNALRISGLGAPRAFYVPVVREIGFPNVSYGEDYSVALRISRHYEVGRIYDSIYYARRWEGNSDSALPLATLNRYDAYKDHLRTVEILARQKMNRNELG